jgi:hypothetical protein
VQRRRPSVRQATSVQKNYWPGDVKLSWLKFVAGELETGIRQMEDSDKSDAIKAGQARTRREGNHMGRPKVVLDCEESRVGSAI